MAKAGKRSQVRERTGAPGATRDQLVDAAVATLQEDGFSGASARAIARRAGCNQALVFYHFGTVANLLVAALDKTSRRRMASYRHAVGGASGLTELVAVAGRIYREDLDAGHMTVLAEVIAGASSTPGLGAEVSAHVAPWIAFTESALRDALCSTPLGDVVPAGELAYAVVALYLGMELLTHLDGDRTRPEALFATAERFAALGASLGLGGPGVAAGAPGALGDAEDTDDAEVSAHPDR